MNTKEDNLPRPYTLFVSRNQRVAIELILTYLEREQVEAKKKLHTEIDVEENRFESQNSELKKIHTERTEKGKDKEEKSAYGGTESHLDQERPDGPEKVHRHHHHRNNSEKNEGTRPSSPKERSSTSDRKTPETSEPASPRKPKDEASTPTTPEPTHSPSQSHSHDADSQGSSEGHAKREGEGETKKSVRNSLQIAFSALPFDVSSSKTPATGGDEEYEKKRKSLLHGNYPFPIWLTFKDSNPQALSLNGHPGTLTTRKELPIFLSTSRKSSQRKFSRNRSLQAQPKEAFVGVSQLPL